MGVVVNDEQAVAEAMWGGDVGWSPKVRGKVDEGTGRFRAGNGVAVALCNKHESQETFFTKLANAGLVGTPYVC
jgi:hypothetical protein